MPSGRRLRTAELALDDGDDEGEFVAAYDAFRMSADALLLAQSLRATGGDGSHVTIADAISAQFGDATPEFRRVIFDRLRRTRHAIQYFDPTATETTIDDAAWGSATATSAIDAAGTILDSGTLNPYS